MSSEKKRRLRSRTKWVALGAAITALALLAVVAVVRGKTEAPAPSVAAGPVASSVAAAGPLPGGAQQRLGTIGAALLLHDVP